MTACMTKAQPATVTETNGNSCGSNCYTPRVDVWETDHEFLVHADLPGVQPGNLSLSFENGHLSLHGKVEASQPTPNSLLREYAVGDYYRTFAIHEDVDAGKISADFKQGVLTIKLPKREEIKPRKIEIVV